MSFKTEATPNFVRELKPLAKKYPSLKKNSRNCKSNLRKIRRQVFRWERIVTKSG